MSHIQSLEDICRNDDSGKVSPSRKKEQAAPGGLIPSALRDEYLATARARRAQRGHFTVIHKEPFLLPSTCRSRVGGNPY
jgi:hypothetical protein